MPKKSQYTLCWDCANACGSCPWSSHPSRPVAGWTAIPTKIRLRGPNNKYGEDFDSSFIVLACPLFKRDAVMYGTKWTDKSNAIVRRNVPKRRKP